MGRGDGERGARGELGVSVLHHDVIMTRMHQNS